ncbi:MAG: HAMP domain-containing histidine kinase [Chloroflexi bacterium]|nr:HAMP domain-containing histidine kinase [Chloroflexota bacterium]
MKPVKICQENQLAGKARSPRMPGPAEQSITESGIVTSLDRDPQDLSQRLRQAEERLAVQSQLLHQTEIAHHRRSEYIASLAHELRTPLNSILALSGILLARMDGELSEEQEKQVAMIQKAGQHLTEIINNILDYSRLEAGRAQLYPGVFHAADVVREVTATVVPQLRAKGIVLEVEIAPDTPPLTSDEEKLKEILLNLLSNAVKFTDEGRVRIEVTSSSNSEGECLSFAVSDTGIGIAPENLDSIFQPFNQAARLRGGSGLGLSITQELVDLLRGTISVQSQPGQGSCFRVVIPARLPGVFLEEAIPPLEPTYTGQDKSAQT